MRTYFDGTLVDTTPDPQGGFINTNSNDVWIGGRANSGGMSWFNGYMDEIKIADDLWTDSEVTQLQETSLTETWGSAESGNPVCLDGAQLGNGEVSPSRRFLAYNGEVYFCKIPAGERSPWEDDSVLKDFMYERYECDYIDTGSNLWYCGKGGTETEGEWHTLENSNCQDITRIRGGRIRVY